MPLSFIFLKSDVKNHRQYSNTFCLISMSSEEYQTQKVFRYTRKSFKKLRRCDADEPSGSQREETACFEVEQPPPTQELEWNNNNCDCPAFAGCSCDPRESDQDIASILHKKCPVISLAEQQLQRLLEGTEQLLCDNDRCCRSIFDFIRLCKRLFTSRDKCQYILVFLIGISFMLGLLLGAASCGTYLGRFDSSIFACIDNFFVSDSYLNLRATIIA